MSKLPLLLKRAADGSDAVPDHTASDLSALGTGLASNTLVNAVIAPEGQKFPMIGRTATEAVGGMGGAHAGGLLANALHEPVLKHLPAPFGWIAATALKMGGGIAGWQAAKGLYDRLVPPAAAEKALTAREGKRSWPAWLGLAAGTTIGGGLGALGGSELPGMALRAGGMAGGNLLARRLMYGPDLVESEPKEEPVVNTKPRGREKKGFFDPDGTPRVMEMARAPDYLLQQHFAKMSPTARMRFKERMTRYSLDATRAVQNMTVGTEAQRQRARVLAAIEKAGAAIVPPVPLAAPAKPEEAQDDTMGSLARTGVYAGLGTAGVAYGARQALSPAMRFNPEYLRNAMEFPDATRVNQDPTQRMLNYLSHGSKLMGDTAMTGADGKPVSGADFMKTLRTNPVATQLGFEPWNARSAEHYSGFAGGPASASHILATETHADNPWSNQLKGIGNANRMALRKAMEANPAASMADPAFREAHRKALGEILATGNAGTANQGRFAPGSGYDSLQSVLGSRLPGKEQLIRDYLVHDNAAVTWDKGLFAKLSPQDQKTVQRIWKRMKDSHVPGFFSKQIGQGAVDPTHAQQLSQQLADSLTQNPALYNDPAARRAMLAESNSARIGRDADRFNTVRNRMVGNLDALSSKARQVWENRAKAQGLTGDAAKQFVTDNLARSNDSLLRTATTDASKRQRQLRTEANKASTKVIDQIAGKAFRDPAGHMQSRMEALSGKGFAEIKAMPWEAQKKLLEAAYKNDPAAAYQAVRFAQDFHAAPGIYSNLINYMGKPLQGVQNWYHRLGTAGKVGLGVAAGGAGLLAARQLYKWHQDRKKAREGQKA